MQEKMLPDVSFGYSTVVAYAATDVVGDEDDSGCICCLHRKPDLMDYGVMDNPACDCTAEVSTEISNQSSVDSVWFVSKS